MKSSVCVNFIQNNFEKDSFCLWQCDNGKHLKNKKVKKIIKAPYNPQADRQIERPNGTIKRLMKLAQQSDNPLTHREPW